MPLTGRCRPWRWSPLDYRQHNPMVEPGPAGIRSGFAQFLAVFPDLWARVEAMVAEGDLVVARFIWTGTQRGPFLGVAISGRTVSWTSTDWWRIEAGKLAEHWDVVDWAGLLEQLRGTDAGESTPPFVVDGSA